MTKENFKEICLKNDAGGIVIYSAMMNLYRESAE